ncbi:hypothetical protein DPMN_017695 [Dreissena polymorpha]|uniref:Uncharacterized protein n=1 Tax=Dreissena polymorpha TaxID=45954 RepID=A0A9D4NI07_DREPO|nr:hypothetical protein DPMN_017695 [Dreissena polymorpha]
MAESEMDSIQQRVLRKARELNRLKAVKASETSLYEDLEGGNPRPRQIQLNIDSGNHDTSPVVFSIDADEAGNVRTTSQNGVQSLHPLDVTPLVFTPSKPGHYTHQDID